MMFERLDNHENYKPPYSTIDNQDGAAIAEELEYYVAWPHQSGALPGLTAAGKNFLVYKNIRMFDKNFSTFKEEYLLRDVNGNIISAKGYTPLKLTDPMNPAYRQYLTNWFQKYKDQGYQGIFHDNGVEIDVFDPWFYDAHPVNPRTGVLYTETEFVEDCLDLANWLVAQHPDMIHHANGFWSGHRYNQKTSNFNYVMANADLDNIFSEGMWGNTYGVLWRENNWKESVDFLKDVQSKWLSRGKTFTIYTNTGGADTVEQEGGVGVIGWQQSALFQFASSLLAIDRPGNIFSFHKAMSRPFVQDLLKLDVGVPLGNYYKSGSVYKRDWTNVTVYVNPTYSTQTVDDLTMPPLSGEIIINEIPKMRALNFVASVILGISLVAYCAHR